LAIFSWFLLGLADGSIDRESRARAYVLLGICALLAPGVGRAGVVNITENPADTSSGPVFVRPHTLMPGMSPFTLPLTGTPAFATLGADFKINMDTLSASNAAGLALTYNVTALVTDVTGVKADLVLQ